MTRSYAVHRTIDASPEAVWQLLTDGPRYPEWNPAVLSLDGQIMVGEKLAVVSIMNPKRAYPLRVTELDPPRRMVWTGALPLGLFTGARTFRLQRRDAGTEFTMEEVFTGPLAPAVFRAIPDMTDSFVQFADGLKRAAESRVGGG